MKQAIFNFNNQIISEHDDIEKRINDVFDWNVDKTENEFSIDTIDYLSNYKF